MNIDLLVKMVNEIGDFWAGESSPEQAPRDVASHLKRFWEVRMRRQIIGHYEHGGAGLSETALKAVALLAAESATQPRRQA